MDGRMWDGLAETLICILAALFLVGVAIGVLITWLVMS